MIEYTDGVLHVHNNTVGVMTNDPPFDWHLRNLNNYVSIRRRWPVPGVQQHATEVGPVPQAVGHGANLLGLPGDATPAGRFVRLFYLREAARQPQSVEDALVLAQSLVNTVFIIDGTVAEAKPLETGYDRTMWATLKVPSRGSIFVRSYSSMQWQEVKLSELDLSPGAPVRLLPLPSGLSSKDASHDLR